jgi:hypothetical protein
MLNRRDCRRGTVNVRRFRPRAPDRRLGRRQVPRGPKELRSQGRSVAASGLCSNRCRVDIPFVAASTGRHSTGTTTISDH